MSSEKMHTTELAMVLGDISSVDNDISSSTEKSFLSNR
jgi:hypothetical protein